MIAAVAQRRAVGDWRGACAAADVDVCLKPDSLRRFYGSEIVDQLLNTLRELSPDLLRWHLPRRGHGSGDLLAGVLVPLADLTDLTDLPHLAGGRRRLTLAAATPRFALDAGQRIVLVALGDHDDEVTRAVLDAVRLKQVERHSLVRHRMFWSADAAPGLASLCDDDADGAIARMQDSGDFAEAWNAAGFRLRVPEQPSRARWLAALPIRLPGLAARVREALPGVDEAVVRSGVGALMLSGLTSSVVGARVVPDGEARGLPVVPHVVWSRVLDADLLRLGHLGGHELHPLVASALLGQARPTVLPEPDEWLYREVPFIEGPCDGAVDGALGLWIGCGTQRHRVAFRDDAWQTVDHVADSAREDLLSRLGGPANPCRQALDYLVSGRHVIELAESLLAHGRGTEVRDLLRSHTGARGNLDKVTLSTGGTVAEALAAFAEKTLRHRMILAGATRRPASDRWSLRKGDPARTHR